MRLSTVGDLAFPVAAARTWNSLPRHVTLAPSVSWSSFPLPAQVWLYQRKKVRGGELSLPSEGRKAIY